MLTGPVLAGMFMAVEGKKQGREKEVVLAHHSRGVSCSHCSKKRVNKDTGSRETNEILSSSSEKRSTIHTMKGAWKKN